MMQRLGFILVVAVLRRCGAELADGSPQITELGLVRRPIVRLSMNEQSEIEHHLSSHAVLLQAITSIQTVYRNAHGVGVRDLGALDLAVDVETSNIDIRL